MFFGQDKWKTAEEHEERRRIPDVASTNPNLDLAQRIEPVGGGAATPPFDPWAAEPSFCFCFFVRLLLQHLPLRVFSSSFTASTCGAEMPRGEMRSCHLHGPAPHGTAGRQLSPALSHSRPTDHGQPAASPMSLGPTCLISPRARWANGPRHSLFPFLFFFFFISFLCLAPRREGRRDGCGGRPSPVARMAGPGRQATSRRPPRGMLLLPRRGAGADRGEASDVWMDARPPTHLNCLPTLSLPRARLGQRQVDRIWSICLPDMVCVEEILGNSLQFVSDELLSQSSENALKAMLFLEFLSLLSPEKLSSTYDCIHANYFSLCIPQEFSVSLATYLQSHQQLLGSNFYARRHLADNSIGDAPSMAPEFAPSMSSGDEVKFPQSVTETPYAPSSSHNNENPKQPHHSKPAQKHRGVPPVSLLEKHKDYVRLVLIVVLPTAAFSFVAAFLIFYCCGCNKNKVSVSEQRDDHPLLHMQLANVPGSSHDARVPASPLHKDDQSHSGISMGQCFSCFYKRSIDATKPSEVIGGTPENNVTSDASKPMPPPPPPPPPPPIMKAPPPPPGPPKGSKERLSQLSPVESSRSEGSSPGEQTSQSSEAEVNAPRAKLRPLYWDKVLANPDQSMAWHDIKFGSFHVNEDVIEELFGYSGGNGNNLKDKELPSADPASQHISLLNVKKSCNLAVVFKAMNIRVQDIHDALIEGNELPRVLLETILRMKPTDEEEQKLRLYNGDISQLGLAEQVMKALIDIPFAFKRVDTLLFMSSLQEDASSLRDSFHQLEAACMELKHRLFLKLLEAVLKTGNRLNDGTFRGGANAFKLDTLLKLSDVKGADGKTTLLHFVVQEIIRSEGVREARLGMESGTSPTRSTSDDTSSGSLEEDGDYYSNRGLRIVSGLSSEMDNVKRVAALDAEPLFATVVTLRQELLKSKEFLNEIETIEETSGFRRSLERFVEHADNETNFLMKEEKRLRSLVKKTIRYFHGNGSKDDGFRLFVIVRDFLMMLDKACKEVGASQKKGSNKSRSSGNGNPTFPSIVQEQQFPAVIDGHSDSSHSND